MRFRTRHFFLIAGVLLGLLLGLPLKSLAAQQTLAAIITSDLPRYQQVHATMVKVLQAGGFGEDKLKVFIQTPNADKMSLINSLRRAEAAGANVIVTYGSRATAAAKSEIKNTPLLFADVYDPVALGAVKTLAAPGTDASGATSKTDLALLVSSMTAIKPLKKVGVLYTKGEEGSEQQLAELTSKGKEFGFAVEAENARNPQEALTLAEKLATGSDALFLTESIAAGLQAKAIVAAAQTKNCAVFSQIPGLVEAGALLGLEAEIEEQGKLVAVHALQVLQGQKAHLLPVREGKKVILRINQKAAVQMGLTIPRTLATKATLM